MTQATILAAAQTAATSSDVVVAAGSSVTVGMFTVSGVLPAFVGMSIMLDTPGGDLLVGVLDLARPAVVLDGPGTYRVVRGDITAQGVDVGVYSET